MKIALATLVLLLTVSAHALDTAALVEGSAAALLGKKCIRTEVGGVLPVPFDAAIGVLDQPDLILHIQEAYRASISKEGARDLPIVGSDDGAYHYTNEKNHRTDFFELYRGQTSDTSFDLVYLAKGKRHFGKYEILIHIHVVDAEAAGTLYIAEVHAYPRNAALRFFARRLGTVERYFQRKTHLIAGISAQLCMGMEPRTAFVYQPPTLALNHD